MKAVILAGGKGTRLRPLTYTTPKPLLPLAGKPAIARLIEKLARERIDEIIVTTNYFARQLHNVLGDGSEYGVRIHHVEEKTPLGTAGSVKNSESLIHDTFLVIQGDNQFEFGLSEVVNLHRKLDAATTIALVRVENPSEYGIVELSNGQITRFQEKPSPQECFSNLINTGIYVVEPEALKLIPESKMFDFSRDLFPRMLKSRLVLAGAPVNGFWVDVGSPHAYLKANVWALDNPAPEAKTAGDAARQFDASISEAATLRGPVYVGKNVTIEKDAVIGPYVCIGDGCKISASAKLAFSAVYENTQIGMNAVLDTCVVAENCRIGGQVQIERDTVVGAGTDVGDGSKLTAESRVGPFVVVQPHTVVEGTVTAHEKDIERISAVLEKSHVRLGLTNEEARAYAALCELGEAELDTVARLANIPNSMALSVLAELEERGLAVSLGTMPKMYALTREEAKDSGNSS